MFHWSLPPAATGEFIDLTSGPSPSRMIMFILGTCPVRLRGSLCVADLDDGVDPVLVGFADDEIGWGEMLIDVIDAWETALQTRDEFWIRAVSERIRKIAEMSNGLIEYAAAPPEDQAAA